MKCSDAIAQIVKKETEHVFGVTGGCIVNTVDSLFKAGVKIVPMHHEQSAAIAADAYARFKPLGVCFSTSGPGATNLLTGVCCSYYDSVPVLAISGQVPSGFLTGRDRQMGFQETDGVEIFKPITKACGRFNSLKDLTDCITIAKTPRKGPCFLEIPDDIQRKQIPSIEDESPIMRMSPQCSGNLLFETEGRAKKPIAIVGAGANDCYALDIKIPFLYTWRTKDRYYNHPFCVGGFGTTGGTHGNKLLKEADLVIMIGTRMDSHTTPDWEKFAPNAYKIAVGIDFPHDGCDENHDVDLSGKTIKITGGKWATKDLDISSGPAYQWVDTLCAQSQPEDIIIPDMGQIGCIAFQRWAVKEGQRLFNGMNHSPMGYSLPGSIGAAVATGKRVIVIIGDGSLMMNIHDLQTISDMKLPINVFVVTNGGYGMIRQTQDDWKQYLAQGVACDFKIPDIKKLADAFGLKYSTELNDGPSIGEIKITDTRITPKWKWGTEL